jgi:anti-sigma-K factor RskA
MMTTPTKSTKGVLWRSKTFWGAILAGAAHVAGAAGVIPPGIAEATGEALGAVIAAAGVRTAIAKNGEGK